MAKKNENTIDEIHERHMRKFMRQIRGAIRNINMPAESLPDVRNADAGPGSTSGETRASIQEEHSGPDKVNEIRNEVVAPQSEETRQSIAIRNPDKQKALMEIVKKRSEKFEQELRDLKSLNSHAIESAAQKFKSDLMDNVRKQLTESKPRLSSS
jgi:hypothetical protein